MNDVVNRLEGHKVAIFARNIDLVPQQKKSRLLSHVDADTAYSEHGDRWMDDTMGLSDPQEVMQDVRPTPGGEIDKFRRFAFFSTYDDGKWVGTREKAEQLVDPTNKTVMAMGAGRERRRDKKIMSAMYDSMWVNDENGTPGLVDLPSSQVVAVNDWTFFKGKADGGGTAPTEDAGLTVPKLRKAKVIASNHIIDDMGGEWCIAYEEEDLQNLLTSVEVASADYNKVLALIDGEIDLYKGFRWVKVDNGRCKYNAATTTATLPIWHTGNIQYKERPLVTTRVGERPDYSYRWHAFYEAQDSVLRRFDTGVIHVLCKR